jgi:hypothetical protein
MPKRIFKFQGFYGGINDVFSPRDLSPTQLTSAQNIDVSDLGQIKMMGAEAAHSDVGTQADKKSIQNWGLFFYSTDRLDGADAAETGEDWILFPDIGHASNRIYKFGRVLDAVSADTIDLAGTALRLATATDPTANISVGDFVGNGADFTSATNSVGLVYAVTSTYIVISYYQVGDSDWANLDVIYNGLSYVDTAATDSTETVEGASAAWTGAVDFKPVFYAVDGAVRVSNANFDNTTENKWHGYIKRKHFDGLAPGAAADNYNDWYTSKQALSAPTRGFYVSAGLDDDATASGTAATVLTDTSAVWDSGISSEVAGHLVVNIDDDVGVLIVNRLTDTTLTTAADGGLSWTANDEYRICPPAGTGFNVQFVGSASGNWDAGTYEVATTFIYDGNQESLLYLNSGDGIAITADHKVGIKVTCASPFDPRITGGRVYVKLEGLDTEWTLLADISLKEGIRADLTSEYTSWVLTGMTTAASDIYLRASCTSDSLSSNTYGTINGFSPEQQDIGIGDIGMGYKCACVAGNRKAYVANVKMKDSDGETVIRGDLMLESKANKFDTFLWEDRVEVAINDGDDVTAIVPFADRILQFKKKKLYVINVSQDISFLEDQFSFRGIEGYWQVCMTELGPVWFNEHGIFLYNGDKVIDLTEDSKLGKRKFDWASYYTTITDVSIAYIAKKKQILIVKDTSNEATLHDILIYDIRTQSFVEGYRKVGAITTASNNLLTNLINDWNDDVVYCSVDTSGDDLYFKKWDTDATLVAVKADFVLFTTRMEDFGTPDTKKVAYKVTITHNQTSDTTATLFLYYRTDEGSWTEVEQFADQSQMAKQEFDFSSYIEDFYEMQFKVAAKTTTGAGDVEAAFQIDEISVVVRDKVVA